MSVNLINQAIEEYGILAQIDGMPGQECEASKFHSPTPLACVQADLADILACPNRQPRDPVWLCHNCLTNLRIFVHLLVASQGNLPWETRRQFGNLIRDLGAKTWESYHQDRLASGQQGQEPVSD